MINFEKGPFSLILFAAKIALLGSAIIALIFYNVVVLDARATKKVAFDRHEINEENKLWADLAEQDIPEDLELYLGITVGECSITAVPTDSKFWEGVISVVTYNGSVRCSSNGPDGHSNVLITARFYEEDGQDGPRVTWQIDEVFMSGQDNTIKGK